VKQSTVGQSHDVLPAPGEIRSHHDTTVSNADTSGTFCRDTGHLRSSLAAKADLIANASGMPRQNAESGSVLTGFVPAV
jgi:hypothetical protein